MSPKRNRPKTIVSALFLWAAASMGMASARAQTAPAADLPPPSLNPFPPPPYPIEPRTEPTPTAGSNEGLKVGPKEGPSQALAPPVMQPVPPPPPYSLPFGLRPIIPVTVLRLDTTFAFYEQNIAGQGQPERWEPGFTSAFLPTIGYKWNPSWMGIFRFGLVGNRPPRITGDEPGADPCEDVTTTDATTGQTKTQTTKCGVASTNLLLGGFYSHKFAQHFRVSVFAAIALPVGSGVSSTTEPGASGAEAPAGQLSRSALDNVMFAVNDLSLVEGLDLAFIGHRLTVQAEVTVFQLFRARNELANLDAYKVNFTAGLHVGYFVTGWLSLAAELRYQRWLSDPKAVLADEANAEKGLPVQGLRHNLSVGVGPRFHIKLPGGKWIRPALVYEPGLAGLMATRRYHVLQLDIPILF